MIYSWLEKLHVLWHRCSHLGVSERYPDETYFTIWYNRMSFISIVAALFLSWLSYQVGFHPFYSIVTFLVAVFFAMVPALHYFGKIYMTRYLISLASPLWANGIALWIGGSYGQETITLAAMAVAFLAFQSKPRVRISILAYQFLAYIGAAIWVKVYGPILGEYDLPYDEVIVFIAAIGWISVVLISYSSWHRDNIKNLQSKNTKLVATTEELERFTHIASHDLKSPLRTIISFIGIIERNIEREKYSQISEDLAFVKSGARQMNKLIDDIQELTKQNDTGTDHYKKLDLNVIFQKVKFNLKKEIETRMAILETSSLPTYWGLEVDFILIFQNIIQNGIKYNSSDHPQISITAKNTNDQIEIQFKDNGIGIPDQYQPQIFQLFKRLHSSDEYEGTGLGLGLCKKIITKYKGTISVQSKENVGSTFIVKLPVTHLHKQTKGSKSSNKKSTTRTVDLVAQ